MDGGFDGAKLPMQPAATLDEVHAIVEGLRAESATLREMVECSRPMQLAYMLRSWRARSLPTHAAEANAVLDHSSAPMMSDLIATPSVEPQPKLPRLYIKGIAYGTYPDGSTRRPQPASFMTMRKVAAGETAVPALDLDLALFGKFDLERVHADYERMRQQGSNTTRTYNSGFNNIALARLRKHQDEVALMLNQIQMEKLSAR